VEGVKIHHLQVIRGTPMERMFREGKVSPLSWESYPALVSSFLEELPSSVVIHRFIADAPEEKLIAPNWPPKARVLQAIRNYMERKGHWQGRLWEKRGGGRHIES
jgi:radical SAM superfamily enzyme